MSKISLPVFMQQKDIHRISFYSLYLFVIIISITGIPGFTKFDPTGETRELGIFNAQSLSRIFLYIFFLVFIILFVFKQQNFLKYNQLRAGLPLLLFYLYLLINNIFVAGDPFNVAQSSYRVAEWLIILFLGLFFLEKYLEEINIFRIVSVSVIAMLVILLLFFLFTDLAFTYSEQTSSYRLGGFVYGPNGLGLLIAIMIFIVCYSKLKLFYKIFFTVILIGLLLLTYSRGAELGLLIGIMLAFLLSRVNVIYKVSGFLIISSLLIMGGLFWGDSILTYLQRGHGVEELMSLSGRTSVWEASLLKIKESPWFGYGFFTGSKDLHLYMFTDFHWKPSWTHTDFLEMFVSGGIISAAFTLFIYIDFPLQVARMKKKRRVKMLFFLVYSQCLIYGILTPFLNTMAAAGSVVFVYLYLYVRLNSLSRNENSSSS